jgi:hypothetical protein
MEDSMSKGVEGYVVPPWPRYGGGEEESAGGAGRRERFQAMWGGGGNLG